MGLCEDSTYGSRTSISIILLPVGAHGAGRHRIAAQPPAQTNGLQNLRADTVEFLYGPSQTPGSALPLVEFPCGSWNATLCEQLEPVMKPGASFFRLISSNYIAEVSSDG